MFHWVLPIRLILKLISYNAIFIILSFIFTIKNDCFIILINERLAKISIEKLVNIRCVLCLCTQHILTLLTNSN